MGMDCYSHLFVGTIIDEKELYESIEDKYLCGKCETPGISGKFCQECGGKISSRPIKTFKSAIIKWTRKTFKVYDMSDQEVGQMFLELCSFSPECVEHHLSNRNGLGIGLRVLATPSHRGGSTQPISISIDELFKTKTEVALMLEQCLLLNSNRDIKVFLQISVS